MIKLNKNGLLEFRNSIKARLVRTLGVKENIVIFNTHNSWQHELIKARICFELQKQGKRYITELKMGGKGIADIVILDDATIIEILVSETLEQAEYKVRKYPDLVQVVAVRSHEDYFTDQYRIIKEKLI